MIIRLPIPRKINCRLEQSLLLKLEKIIWLVSFYKKLDNQILQ